MLILNLKQKLQFNSKNSKKLATRQKKIQISISKSIKILFFNKTGNIKKQNIETEPTKYHFRSRTKIVLRFLKKS